MNDITTTGPPDATLVIIGDISGYASHHFDSLVGQAGILRSSCRIIHVTSIPTTMWEDKKRTIPTKELQLVIQYIYIELSKLPNVRVIIALDRDLMYIMTRGKQDGISKWAGSISMIEIPTNQSVQQQSYKIRTVKMIATFPPSFALKQWTINPLIVHDLKRAKGEVDNSAGLPERELIPYPTNNQIKHFFEQYEDEVWPKLYVDIECYKGIITRISFAYTKDYAISIPFYNYDTDTILSDRDWIIDIIREVLNKAPVVGQNFGVFDRYWIKHKWGVECNNIVGDTMIAQHVILPGLPQNQKPLGLAMLVRLFTRERFYKDEGKIIASKKIMPLDKDQGIYSCKDAVVTCEVYQNQQNTPQARRRKATYDLEMALWTRPIWYMMNRGILFDKNRQKQLRIRYKKELEYLELSINDCAGKAINIRSPKQMAELLYDDLNLKGPKNRSTNSEEIFILTAKYPNEPVLAYMRQYRKIDKIYTTILAMKVDNDSRFRCTYSPTTTTGRFKSYSNPFGLGCNGQNIVRMDKDPNIRPLFYADRSHYLVEADLEQAELRAVAYYANDARLIELISDDNTDIHSWMASKILGREITKANVAERQLGKRIVHAGNYLISARGLVRTCRIELGIDMTEVHARNLLKMYFTAFPAIKRWHKQIERTLQLNNNVLVTSLGRERKFFERWGPELFRKATAFLPQSTIADLLNIIMLNWFDKYNGKNGCELLLQLHDAFYTQCPEENIKAHLATLNEVFKQTITINRHTVTIPIGIKVSRCWGGEKVVIRDNRK